MFYIISFLHNSLLRLQHLSDVSLSWTDQGSLTVLMQQQQQRETHKVNVGAPTDLSPGTFMLHSYLLFCYAEWWLNNMHYPCHQPQGSIFPVLLVGPGSLWSDGVSFPADVGDWRPNFHSSTDWYAWGKGWSVGPMKWDYEDEGICWLYICVNGTLDFSFPISALMICLRLLPWRSAPLPYPLLITWEQHALQVPLMAPPPPSTVISKFDFITSPLAHVDSPPRQYIICSSPHDMSNIPLFFFSASCWPEHLR